MDVYTCTVCGYEYVRDDGDTESNIEAGTDFEDIPPDWTCPVCGAPQEEFELVNTDED